MGPGQDAGVEDAGVEEPTEAGGAGGIGGAGVGTPVGNQLLLDHGVDLVRSKLWGVRVQHDLGTPLTRMGAEPRDSGALRAVALGMDPVLGAGPDATGGIEHHRVVADRVSRRPQQGDAWT